MGVVDDILMKIGLKYEDLTEAERETLTQWTQVLQSNQLTLDSVRQFVRSLRDGVEQELTKTDFGSKQDMFLKARLRNLMLLEAFMVGPEKAKEAVDRAIAGIVSNRK